MSENFRKESRKDFHRESGATSDDLRLGCLQRIADAMELMAKRHDELVRAKESAEREAHYYRDLYRSLERSLRATRGQVTRLKNAATAKTTVSAA